MRSINVSTLMPACRIRIISSTPMPACSAALASVSTALVNTGCCTLEPQIELNCEGKTDPRPHPTFLQGNANIRAQELTQSWSILLRFTSSTGWLSRRAKPHNAALPGRMGLRDFERNSITELERRVFAVVGEASSLQLRTEALRCR